MQKILLAMNALDPKNPSIHFASYIANLTKSKVIGVFTAEKCFSSTAPPTWF